MVWKTLQNKEKRGAFVKKLHYSWVICGVGMLMYFCNMGLCNNGFSVCLPFIEEAGHFTGTQGSMIMTVRCISSLITMFFVAKFYDRVSMRLGAFLATLSSALGYFIYSIGGSIGVYYVGAAVAGVGYSFGAIIPASILVNNWFIRRRGLALGISTSGTGICSVIAPGVITWCVEHLGLRPALQCVSGFILLGGVVILLLARRTPADMGMEPFGAGEDVSGHGKVKSHGTRCMTKTEWLFAGLALMMVGAVATGGTGHFSILMTSSGFSPAVAAAVFSFWGVMLIAGKFFFGYLSDHLNGKWATVICFGIYVLGGLSSLLFFSGQALFCYLFALLTGLGISPVTVGPPVWAADLSTPDKYARTLKSLQMCYTVGGVVFTSVPGMLYDALGNYQSAYLMFSAFALLATTIISVLYARFRKNS